MTKLRHALVAAAVSAIAFVSAPEADAAITINMTQDGADVVVTGSGSFDTTGLSRYVDSGPFSTGMNPELAVIRFGNGYSAGPISAYQISGPVSFGSSPYYRVATTAIGDEFGFVGAFAQLILPLNYVSGTSLSGKLTFANATFASLGLSNGTYTYANARDRVTVSIGNPTPAVPEPATWAMMILGFGVVGYSLRRKTMLRFV